MLTKVIGVIFILIALVLSLVFIGSSVETLTLFLAVFSDSSGYALGYLTGDIIVKILLFIIIKFLLKKGIKWIKGKPNLTNQISNIGKE